jgi:Flp pilus assembly pilin Flp
MIMTGVTPFLQRLISDDEGQDLIEYALLATFVSLIAIAGATLLGGALNNWYSAVGDRVSSAAATAGGS